MAANILTLIALYVVAVLIYLTLSSKKRREEEKRKVEKSSSINRIALEQVTIDGNLVSVVSIQRAYMPFKIRKVREYPLTKISHHSKRRIERAMEKHGQRVTAHYNTYTVWCIII